ncbi:MAG: DUF370 domain-containing protein [Peptococcaceae bacterium]|nr:DUF370 domain-containing protein [Peptococcaceae bacterium]
MFLHLGGDYIIPSDQIIGVFDIKTAKALSTREFLKRTHSRNMHVNVAEDQIPKAFVVTNDKIYLSAIAGATLRRRCNFLSKSKFT